MSPRKQIPGDCCGHITVIRTSEDVAGAMQGRRGQILYLDDEPKALKYFKSIVCNEYDVVTCSTVEDALFQLEKGDGQFEVIVADDRMPCISGVEFLQIVTSRWPESVRILTTAYAEPSRLCQCFNEGQVDRVILKPWAEDALRVALSEAIPKLATRSSTIGNRFPPAADMHVTLVGDEMVRIEMALATIEQNAKNVQGPLPSVLLMADQIRGIRQSVASSRTHIDALSDLLSGETAVEVFETCETSECLEEAVRAAQGSNGYKFKYQLDVFEKHCFQSNFACVVIALSDIMISCQRAVAKLPQPEIRFGCFCEDGQIVFTFEDNGDCTRFFDDDLTVMYFGDRLTLGTTILKSILRNLGARMTFEIRDSGNLRTRVTFKVNN